MSNLKLFNQTIANAKTQEYLASVLGSRKGEFVNNLTALVSNNSMLQECEPMTLMFAAMKSTALDLPLDQNLGFAWVIPFKDNKAGKTLAQWQLGFKGLQQLAVRSGEYKHLHVTDVREGELKGRDRMRGIVNVEFIEDDAERLKLKTIGYLGFFELKSGYTKQLYMSVEELEAHGVKYSQTFKRGYGVWKDEFDKMAKKTIIKMLLNKGDAPLSIQMQQAIKYDQAVILDENGTAKYIDNEKKSAAELAAEIQDAEEVTEEETAAIPAETTEEVSQSNLFE